MTQLNSSLTLPCGAVLENRLAKAAMTEGLGTADGRSTPELERLYSLWSQGGAGLLLTGNVIVDRDHLERPGNVVIHGAPDADAAERLKRYAAAATQAGNHCWVQLSHGGRQVSKLVNPSPKAPSAVKLALPGGQFGEPQALEVMEIRDIVERFGIAAESVVEAGFTGVQIHAAHGYLLSSFLSPRTNLRTDEYGGSIDNRARMLLEVLAEIRTRVGPETPVAVKLNSADFQRGGFAFEDSVAVVKMLEEAGIDLVEISGGTYEQPKLLGIEGVEPEEEQSVAVAASTKAREAYFVDFAKVMQEKVSVPLMVTGGFRTPAAMEEAVASGTADVVGIGRPYCVMTDAARQVFDGIDRLPSPENELGLIPRPLGFLKRLNLFKVTDSFATQYWFYEQLYALGHSGKVAEKLSPFAALRAVETRNRALVRQRN